MKTTRSKDLDFLTLKMEESQDETHAKSVREQIYEQSKDFYLEKKRKELEEWIIKGLYAFKSDSPRKKQQMAEAELNIDRIEREIKLYSSSAAFQQTLARAAGRISRMEADTFVVKSKKGLL